MYSVSTFFRQQFDTTVPYVDKVKSVKKHWGFPTKVSDMARNMKMELHTFSLILYQSKKCGMWILACCFYQLSCECEKIVKKLWKISDLSLKYISKSSLFSTINQEMFFRVNHRHMGHEFRFLKNEWLWKFWKRNDLYENFEKGGGVVEKRGEEEAKFMPHVPVINAEKHFLVYCWKQGRFTNIFET
jgi:hypothetical protein